MKLTKSYIKKLVTSTKNVLDSLNENEIAGIIQQANYAYYNTSEPLFDDNIFDIIKEYLEAKNPQNPILKNIGSAVGDSEKKFKLPFFMASLDKIKTNEKTLQTFKSNFKESYVISEKLDGISALIFKSKSGDIKMCTRGDGSVGQDVSHLIPFIKKSKFKVADIPKDIGIRGELICSKLDFKMFANKMANARNMVAGQINAKIPDLDIVSHIQFIAYELINVDKTNEAQFKELKKYQTDIVHYQVVKEKDLTIQNLSDILIKRRAESFFEIDGIVVMHNDIHERVEENPSYGFAFKSVHTMSKAEVIVTDVEWNTSKDGYMIPVINFNEVNLAGVNIKRAHGFNGKFIKDNVIGPGSKLIIIRSGDVIPYVQEILTPASSGTPQLPDENFSWSATGVDIIKTISINDDNYKQIENFFDKINVPGLSKGNIKKIFDGGYKTVSSIFNLTSNDLLNINGFKDKMAEKLANALAERKKNIDCISFITASNALGRGFGETKIKLIIDAFPKILTHEYIPSREELVALKGVEKKTADAFIKNIPLYYKFKKESSVNCSSKVTISNTSNTSATFNGINIIFTGFRSKTLEDFVTERGGVIKTGMSKNVNLVVRKDNEQSSKVEKAQELGIHIVNLSDFEKEHDVTAK